MAVPGVGPSSGSKLYIGSSNATHADPTTDSYTEVGRVSNMGAFGRVYALITFDDLGSRNTLKFKGQRNDGKMQIDLGRSPADSGQAAVIVARDNDNDFNWQVTLNDSSEISGSHPTTFYFLGKVMTYTCEVMTPNSVVHAKMELELKSGSIQEIEAT